MYTFVPQEFGPLKIFEKPVTGMQYTIGIDASTGLADDYTSMQVLTNTRPTRQAAAFRAKWTVNDVSSFADKLGRYYNEALIICEINYPGNSVQDALLQYYRYPRNYQPETHLNENLDISCKYGFRTTEATKWILINEMQLAMSRREVLIYDQTTISEFLNFVYLIDKRKAGSAAGFNDDTVMAMMLAYHGVNLYPITQIVPTKEKKTNISPEAKKTWDDFRRRLTQPRIERIVRL